MTALCLLPLMAFAAFGVDLASFYSRASYLQKSADAAALAGTVWMPNLTKARQIACDSLLNNNIDGGDCGTGPFNVTIERGSTATSLLVTVTDPAATKYFSQVFGSGDQALARAAEAEYNLPLPLGSPLNYFGGDTSQTNNLTHVEYWDEIAWPTDYNMTVHAPVNTPCNIGTSATQNFGRWTSATTFDANGFSGSHAMPLRGPPGSAVGHHDRGAARLRPPHQRPHQHPLQRLPVVIHDERTLELHHVLDRG